MRQFTLPLLISVILIAAGAQAQNQAYAKCGGSGWCLNTDCVPGYICSYTNDYYSQCVPAPVPAGNLAPYAACTLSSGSICCPGYECTTRLSPGWYMCAPVVYGTLTTANTCVEMKTSSAVGGKASSMLPSEMKLSTPVLMLTSTTQLATQVVVSTSTIKAISSSSSSELASTSVAVSSSDRKASSSSSSAISLVSTSSVPALPSVSSKASSIEVMKSTSTLISLTKPISVQSISSSKQSSSTSSSGVTSISTSTSSGKPSSELSPSKQIIYSTVPGITSINSSSTSSSTKPSTVTIPPSSSVGASTVVSSEIASSSVAPLPQIPYGQCGGIGWNGPMTCSSGYTCIPQAGNPYYSQCLPATSSTSAIVPPISTPIASMIIRTSTISAISPSAVKPSTTMSTSSQTVPVSPGCMPTPQSCAVTNSPPSCAGRLKFYGINIAGCDFGTDIWGNQSPSNAYCPIGQNYPDGVGQMTHFAQDGFNFFRIPTGWQFIVNSNSPTATLDPTNWGIYKSLVQACLNTGAYCLIDIHNYARFNGQIIGQGGPSDAMFAQLWSNIASNYLSNPKVMFGIMNEPHDLPSISTWRNTVQTVVTAIRSAGASSQMILLPGTDWTGASTFSTVSGPLLATVTNLDGSTTNLIFDVHKYLDSDGSGTHTTCVTDAISSAFAPLAQWLRCNGRQAILSETGGSNDVSCKTDVCAALAYLGANSDVYLGFAGWAAGSFSAGGDLNLTPLLTNGHYVDTALVSLCMIPH